MPQRYRPVTAARWASVTSAQVCWKMLWAGGGDEQHNYPVCAPADAGVLRLGLKGQGKERGEGREGPYAQTTWPPQFGSFQSGIISPGVDTRVELSAWLRFRSAEHRLR